MHAFLFVCYVYCINGMLFMYGYVIREYDVLLYTVTSVYNIFEPCHAPLLEKELLCATKSNRRLCRNSA